MPICAAGHVWLGSYMRVCVCVCVCVRVCAPVSSCVCCPQLKYVLLAWLLRGRRNDAREPNGIKVHYSPYINFMREDRSNKHSEQSWNRTRVSHLQMDTLAGCGWHWVCLILAHGRSQSLFLTSSIYVSSIRGVTFAHKPRAMGQFLSECPELLFCEMSSLW